MQRKISADASTALAKVFAGLPFPIVGLMLAASVYNGQVGLSGVLAGLAFLAAYFWIARRFVWSLIDEVTDCGDYLLARRGRVEDRILLSDIEDIVDRPYARPPKAIVTLKARSAFGWSLVFALSPGRDEVDGSRSIAADLRHRVRLATGAVH